MSFVEIFIHYLLNRLNMVAGKCGLKLRNWPVNVIRGVLETYNRLKVFSTLVVKWLKFLLIQNTVNSCSSGSRSCDSIPWIILEESAETVSLLIDIGNNSFTSSGIFVIYRLLN